MWVLKNHDLVFYYVEHALLTINIPNQDDTPFALGIQTTWQCEMISKYGQGVQLHLTQHLAQINAGYGNVFHFVKLLTIFKCFATFNLLIMDFVFCNTLYTQ